MILKIHPLSEKSLTVYLNQEIKPETNEQVMAISNWISQNPFPGFTEIVPAYASFTIFYELVELTSQLANKQTAYDFVQQYVKSIPINELEKPELSRNRIEIPVIYDGKDLSFVAKLNKMTERQLVKIHAEVEYRVYMMGFLPGFAYLGGMNKAISAPRKSQADLKVKSGSVGIAGNQTGIYPFESPGGWQIIGHTELKLFDPESLNLTLLKAGDLVRFRPV